MDRFQKGARLMLRGQWVEVESMSIHKGRPLIKISGIEDLTAAEKLQWEYLEAVGRPELDEDEYLAEDLIGLKVVTDTGQELGEVEDVLPYPAQDVLQVGEILIPLIKQFVKKIDPDNGTITVHLIPGMLPGEEG
jgi:16S rRNA processing protein RimM